MPTTVAWRSSWFSILTKATRAPPCRSYRRLMGRLLRPTPVSVIPPDAILKIVDGVLRVVNGRSGVYGDGRAVPSFCLWFPTLGRFAPEADQAKQAPDQPRGRIQGPCRRGRTDDCHGRRRFHRDARLHGCRARGTAPRSHILQNSSKLSSTRCTSGFKRSGPRRSVKTIEKKKFGIRKLEDQAITVCTRRRGRRALGMERR